jgi:hypothetical protein
MKTVWKYALPLAPELIIAMPEYSEILSVQFQRGMPTMWVLVDPDCETETRVFQYFGTGQNDIPEGPEFNHIETLQFGSGEVYHLFERL